jgi:hypothetical protein
VSFGQPPPAPLTWDWRDIVSSARWAFSDRKILLHARGVAFSYLCVLAYFLLVPALDGASLGSRFAAHRFDIVGLVGAVLSDAANDPSGRPAAAVYLAPVLVAIVWAANAYYAIAVARITGLQVRGHFFAEVRDAVLCARRRIGGVLAVMLVLAAAPMVIAVVMFGGGLLTRLPVAGSVWLAAAPVLMLPAFFLALLCGLLALLLLAGALSLPAMAGVSDDRAVETSYQLVAILWREGWRVMAYHALSVGVAACSGLVFLVVGARSFFWLVGAICAGAPRYASVVSDAGHALWGNLRLVVWLTGWQFAHFPNLTGAESVSAWLTGVGFFGVTVVFVAYVVSVVSVGSSMAYMNLLRRIWDVNVLVASDDETRADAETAPPARPAPTTTDGDGQDG